MTLNPLDLSTSDWSKKPIIEGKSFDDLFQIEGIPLWWFLERFFAEHVIPHPINTYWLINQRGGFQRRNFLRKGRYFLTSQLLKRYILFNEKRKIKQSKKTGRFFPEKKNVLFITYTNHLSEKGEISRLQYLINDIKKDPDLNAFVLFVDPLSRNTYRKILDKINIYDYYDEEISKKAEDISRELFDKWKNLSIETKKKLIRKENVELWPYLKYAFEVYFSKEFLYLLILYHEIMKKIVRKGNIHTFIMTASNSLAERCVIAIAKRENIPSYYIQHGTGEGVLPLKILSTKAVVFSEVYKNCLIAQGSHAEDLIVTGPLIFDELSEYSRKRNMEIENILILTQPFVETKIWSKKQREGFLTASQKIISLFSPPETNPKITVKLHPLENEKDYNSFFKDEANNADGTVTITKDRLYEHIDQADLVIGVSSTTLSAALILDKPVIIVDLYQNISQTGWGGGRFIDKDVFLYLNGLDGIKENVNRFLKAFDSEENRKKRKNYLEKNFHRIDGKAHLRMYQIIKEAISKR